jgi:hypothetical protein
MEDQTANEREDVRITKRTAIRGTKSWSDRGVIAIDPKKIDSVPRACSTLIAR